MKLIIYFTLFSFQGCYVNIDHFKSRVNVLSQKFGGGQPSKRVGNQCMF